MTNLFISSVEGSTVSKKSAEVLIDKSNTARSHHTQSDQTTSSYTDY